MINVKAALLINSILLLSACSTIEQEKPINYYVLDTKPRVLLEKINPQPLQLVGVELPDYLDQPNLVLRDDSQRIHVAYYHSWGDALHTAIGRVLSNEINARTSEFTVVEQCNECRKLTVDISHFYPTTQGEVILSGEYKIKQLGKILQRRHFLIEKDLSEDGYQHAVAQMSNALSELAGEVTVELQRVP